MSRWVCCVTFLIFVVLQVSAQAEYKVCATAEKINDCQALQRGNTKVTCVTVSDTVDCLVKMSQDQADFTMLSAEETILAALTQPDKFSVIASSRHEDRRYQRFAFSAVAIVREDHKGGIEGLEGGGFCHPGYGKGKEQLWSDRVLKYFENKVTVGKRECLAESDSPAYDEAHALSNFFTAACRPGSWLSDSNEDMELKKKFQKLCTLCTADGSSNCDGYKYIEPRSVPGSGHLSAMECLASNRGSVAYIAYKHFMDYFKNQVNKVSPSKFAMLCSNGTVIPLSDNLPAEPPCAWVNQPWAALVSRSSVARTLQNDFKDWMPSGRSRGSAVWIDALDSIIFPGRADVLEYRPIVDTKPIDYVKEGRELPMTEINSCHKNLRWCTINQTEFEKCTWVQKASLTVGIKPEFECVLGTSDIDCLRQIKDNTADFQNLNANYGYLARKFYNQTAVMYEESSNAGRSRVIAVVKKGGNISNFKDLRNKNACFTEYGGIAWTAFIRAAHEQRVISPRNCDYANEVSNFFNAACAPGARDPAHFPSKVADSAKLCSACRGFAYAMAPNNEQGIVTLPAPIDSDQECPTNPTNRFYGSVGALRCLKESNAHVAFLEAQYLKENIFTELSIDPNNYVVLCRNGSLAAYPGFNVDDNCHLSVTIAGEVVTRRNDPKFKSLQYAMQDLDAWFGYASITTHHVNLKVFNEFNASKDVLFKDSTNGLTTKSSENENVLNYVKLFEHVDACSAGTTMRMSILLFTLAFLLSLIQQ